MVNRNRRMSGPKLNVKKRRKPKQKKQIENNSQEMQAATPEKYHTSKGNGISIIVSIVALGFAIASFFDNRHFSQLEYNYKIDPEIDIDGGMGFSIVPEELDNEVFLDTSGLKIVITQKNNLQDAYLIDKDYCVTELDLDEMEDVLETGWKDRADGTNPDMIVNGIKYNYEFLFLEGLDDDCELYLLYSRAGTTKDVLSANFVSEVEVMELEKGHPDDPSYDGERKLAEMYCNILESCEKYILQ